MGRYEVTTEGGTYQIDTEDVSTPNIATPQSEPDNGYSFSNVLQNITSKEGWSAALDKARQGFSNAADNITSKDWWLTRPSGERLSAEQSIAGPPLRLLNSLTFGTGDEIAAAGASVLGAGTYKQNLDKVRGYETSFKKASPVVDTTLQILGATKLPIGTSLSSTDGVLKTGLKAAAEGAGYGAAYGFGEGIGGLDNRLESSINQGKSGAIAGGVLGTGLKTAEVVGTGVYNFLKDASRKLDLSAYGATKGRIAKVYEHNPEILNSLGEQQNPLSVALDSFKKDGGGAGSMDGQVLLDELSAQTKGYAQELRSKLTEATQKQTDAIIPEFTMTKKYLAKLPGAAKADATKLADGLIKDTVNNTDGTLLSLQAEKVALNPLIKESTYGSTANPGKAEILKYIKADLRKSIEDNYQKITGNPSSEISKLNQEIQNRFNLEPLFENLRNSGESRNVVGSALNALKTTSGAGQTLIAGAATGTALGLGAGVAAIPAAAYLQTPQGQRALATGLRSLPVTLVNNAIGAGASLAGKAIPSIPATVGVESSVLNKVFTRPNSDRGLQSVLRGDMSENTPDKIKAIEAKIDADPVDKAIYETESGRNPGAKNPVSTASGAFQLLKKTAANLGVKDVFDIEQNYNGYLKLKEENMQRFGADPDLIYAAHYMGAPLLSKVLKGSPLTDSEKEIAASFYNKALPRFRKIYQASI